MLVRIYSGARGLTFDPHPCREPHAVRVPDGSEVVSAFGQRVLMVPDVDGNRYPWFARDVVAAIGLGHPHFDFTPDPERN